MDRKKLILAVVAIVLIVMSAAFILHTLTKRKTPPAVMLQKISLVAVTLPCEVREITIADKLDLSKDSATGYFKMDGKLWGEPHACMSCKETIAAIIIKPGTEKPGMVMTQYKCPKCGKQAYAPQ